jgi:hypothetical protein
VVSSPEPLAAHHRLGEFSSEVGALDDWPKRRALANQASGATRTFILCEADNVVGYYALAAGGVNVAAVRRGGSVAICPIRFRS